MSRRELVGLAPFVATALSGCSERGGEPAGAPADGSQTTPTAPTTYGYGGTASSADSSPKRDESTDGEAEGRSTDGGGADEGPSGTTPTSTNTTTATRTTAAATTAEDDYGEQGYGQYGYGGTA